MKRILLLLACAGWLMAGPAQAELSDPGQIQTEAYIQLVQADQSLDAGRLDEALRQYQAARDYYVRLAREFPGWEPRVIQYRKTYCDNQIADIQRQQAGGQEHGANACLGQLDQRQVGIELHGGDKPEGGQGLAQIAV